MKRTGTIALLMWVSFSAAAETPKPKYGPVGKPLATPLSADASYFRDPKHPAPDFWALIGFYVPQFNGAACSVASLSAVVNAARATRGLRTGSEDANAQQSKLLDDVKVEDWKSRVMTLLSNGYPMGIHLDALAQVAQAALRQYGFPHATAEAIHANDTSEATLQKIRGVLSQNEKSADDFLLSNFDQIVFTDDAHAGHIAPVGAYDAARKRVLILDPDREYYEPYWVSDVTFVKGLATADKSAGKNRGLVWIKLGASK